MGEPSQRSRTHALPGSRFLPILSWLPQWRPSSLKRDLVAALTVTALQIPEAMAYSELAGVPPQAAFYAGPVALVLYAFFGSSRQLVVAISATVAVLSASTVAGIAPAGSARFIALTAALAMLAGVISILAGVLKLGRIAQFFSESVLTGFVFGLALVIAIKQAPKLLGLEAGSGNFFERLWHLVTHVSQTQPLTLVVGGVSLGILWVLGRRVPRLPASLVVLVLGTAGVGLLGLQTHGVKVVGNIPSGLSGPAIPDVGLGDLLKLLPGACGIALVAFAEAIGPARVLATKHRYEVDANQELIGLGASNLGAGLFRGLSVGCSLSKSAANDAAGARTQMPSLLAAGLLALVALFFTPLFRTLPEATLAAIVVMATVGMMDVTEMRRLFKLRRTDFLLAAGAMLSVLVLEVLPGLLVSVGLSVAFLVWRASQPSLSELGRAPGTLDFADVRRTPTPVTLPGLLVLRPNEGIFFANATSLRDAVIHHVDGAKSEVHTVLLDLEVTADLDVPGADMLAELEESLQHRGITLMLSRVLAPTQSLLDRTGVTEKLGADNIHPQTLNGVIEYLAHRTPHSRAEWGLIRDGLHRLSALVEEAHTAAADAQERRRLEKLRGALARLEEDEHRLH
ncbi:sulfate permease [Myxococcus stipitatus DSM 14675]|uniref:Sulfate permease n=1 Tax=Myxococcus stipitatus (strain DSM 14675 / JCM 12634 / Mx s8) TaxID=1278073 RepID=L7U7C5_MYXSD|nr:SulP family inorganic anion transporter [Myxococcus stipitatus]AGC43988.1 sulfate permease [Myxococcus stipitatus DSM 14675]